MKKVQEQVTSISRNDYVFNFGKYKGKSFNEVLDTDPHYIRWCVENINIFNVSPKVETAIEVATIIKGIKNKGSHG